MLVFELLKCCLKLEKVIRSLVGYEKTYGLIFWRNGTLLKAARASVKGGFLHTGGSMSFVAHKQKMTKLKGEEVSSVGMFEETHKKRNKDGTRGEWVEPRAEETFVGFQRGLDGWRQTQPTSEVGSTTQLTSNDITSIWTNVA